MDPWLVVAAVEAVIIAALGLFYTRWSHKKIILQSAGIAPGPEKPQESPRGDEVFFRGWALEGDCCRLTFSDGQELLLTESEVASIANADEFVGRVTKRLKQEIEKRKGGDKLDAYAGARVRLD